LERGHIYSYVMVNNFRTNFQPVQVADVLFRYTLTTYRVAAHSRAPARDFGWGVTTPLSPVFTVGPQEGRLTDSGSFCRLDQPNVILLTMKGAEDGADEYIRNGLILRLAETEGKDTAVTVTLPHYEITQAFETNLVEEDRAVLLCSQHTVRASLSANGIVTIRCRGSRRRPGR
jgi:alpha-mannosidase